MPPHAGPEDVENDEEAARHPHNAVVLPGQSTSVMGFSDEDDRNGQAVVRVIGDENGLENNRETNGNGNGSAAPANAVSSPAHTKHNQANGNRAHVSEDRPGAQEQTNMFTVRAHSNGWVGAEREKPETKADGATPAPPPPSSLSPHALSEDSDKKSVMAMLLRGPQALFQKGSGSLTKAAIGLPPKSILLTEHRKAEKHRKLRSRLRHVHFKLPRKRGPGQGLQPIDPNSAFAERWLIFMVLPLSFELWAFPFRLAFGTPGDFGVMLGDVVCDTFIVIDIIFMFCVSIPAYTYKDQEHDITSFAGIFSFRVRKDLPMRFFPPFIYYLVSATLWGSVSPGVVSTRLWIWWLGSLPRMITRLHRLLTYFRGIETNLEVSVRALQLFKFALIIFLSAHWVGCIFFFLSRLQHFEDVTWIREFEEVLPLFHLQDSARNNRYLLCVYKGFAAMSNLNYGLGLPKNRVEMIWAMITMAVQVYMNALILGTLLNFLVQKDPVQEAHKKRVEDLNSFMEAKNLPAELRDRIHKHFSFQHRKNVQNRAAASVTLPRSLQMKVAEAKYKYIMTKCTDKGRTLQGCSMQFLNAFLTQLKVMHVMAGEELCKKDEIPRELYFVLDGAVHVVDDENRVKRSIRNDVPDMSPIVGEVPFFLGINHSHTIRARPDGSVQLLVLTKEEAGEVFSTYPEEYEQINENLLARFDLNAKGEELGTGGDREMDADTASLKKNIIASMKQRRDRRFAQLLQSVQNGDVEAVMMEARQGADINQRNYDMRTILHMAAEDGNYKMVEMLIEQRADLNAKDRWGQTPLAEAVMNRQGLVAGLLTSYKALLEIENPASVLCQFAYEANLEQVRRMVENSTDPNLKDNDGRTALHVGAAEGRHKIVEYLLSKGAEKDALDRFGGTPLQNAVLNSKVLAVNILKANGATMPEQIGASAMCKAASSGDVNRLRLLHDCDESVDCCDYDLRTALHLAAAEARLLAVSFLLGVSANPNAKDRWGGRPLDDAFEGWSLYHKYCAKLIHGWGGKLGKLEGTEEGRLKLKELEEIDVDDIRTIVKRLIAHDHSNKAHETMSTQEILTAQDASGAAIPIVAELREQMKKASAEVQTSLAIMRKEVAALFQAVAGLTDALSTPVAAKASSGSMRGSAGSLVGVGRAANKNILGWRTDTHTSPLPQARWPKKPPGATKALQKEDSMSFSTSGSGPAALLWEIAERVSTLEHVEDEMEDTDLDDGGAGEGGIDSEEEDILHQEIDALLHAQEMAQLSNTSPEAMAARQFQEIALKVVQFEAAFEALAYTCVTVRAEELRVRFNDNVPARAKAGWLGKVTLEGLPRLLSLLRIDSGVMDMETVYDQACAFSRQNPELDKSKGGAPWKKIRQAVNTITMLKSGLPMLTTDDDLMRASKVTLEALLAGSSLFRRAILAMQIDHKLCSVMDTWIGRILGEESTRKLLAGSGERSLKPGTLVYDHALEPDLAIILSGEVSIEQGRLAILQANPKTTPRNQMLIKGDFVGAYAALGLQTIPGLSAIATKQCSVVVVKSAHAKTIFLKAPKARQELILKAGEAPVVAPESEVKDAAMRRQPSRLQGALSRVGQSARSLLAPAVSSSAAAQTAPGGIKGILNGVKRRLSISSTEAHAAAKPKPEKEAEEADKVLTEIERKWIKDMVESAVSMWGLLSMGQPHVTRGHLLSVGNYLGEVASECFRKMFTADRANLPEQIDQSFFWLAWIAFLSTEVFGPAAPQLIKGPSDGEKTEEEKKEENEEQKGMKEGGKEEEMFSDEESETLLDKMQYHLDKNRWLRRRFFEDEVIDMYEPAYMAVIGNLRDPMPETRVHEFLMHVFVDFPFKISSYNVQEFLNAFLPNRNQAVKAMLNWGDIRKMLRERRLGLTVEVVDRTVFVGSVLNPNTPWMRHWFRLIKLCGVYYFIIVPLRAAFLPWDSMLHPSALGSDLVVDVICALHVIVMFNTAYLNSRATWVTRRVKILNKVNWASTFAALPIDWFAYLCGASNEACCWLRVNKVLLLVNWGERGWIGFAKLRSPSQKVWHTMLYMVSMTLHVAACLWFFVGARYKYWNESHPITWLRVDELFTNKTFERDDYFGLQADALTIDQYIVSLYWVSATLTANGLVGDVIPQNYAEVLFTIVMMALNMTLIRWIVGEVSTLVMGADKKLIEARKELEAVDQFVTGSNLPEKLQKEIKVHFRANNVHGTTSVDQEALLNGMSHSLKVEVASFISREYLDGVELFSGCSERLLDAVSVLLLEVSFAPEEFLFRTSGPAKEMYFVVSGSVDEVVGEGEDEEVEATKRAHSSVGGVAFFFGLRHLHSARASKLTGSTCLRVMREPFFELLKIYPADEEIIGNNAMASLEVVETRGRAGSSRRSGSRRGGSVMSKDKSIVVVEEAATEAEEGKEKEEEGLEQEEEELEIATASGGDSDGSEVSDALEALVGSSMKDKINALKNRRKKQRIALLMHAAAEGDTDKCSRIIRGDLAVNSQDSNKRTVLHVAASSGHLKLVKLLVELRADVQLKDKFGNTPFNDAVRQQHDRVVTFLRETFPNIRMVLPGFKGAVLMCQAAARGDLPQIQRLVENGVSINDGNYDKRTALHVAASGGHVEICKYLLEQKAEPRCRDRFHGTPLVDAVREGQLEVQQLMRENGGNLGIGHGDRFSTALCEYAYEGNLENVTSMLVNGVDPTEGDYDFRTCLHLAACGGRISVVEHLLNNRDTFNVDVNRVDRFGHTPLDDALQHDEAAVALLIKGAGGLAQGGGAAYARLASDQEKERVAVAKQRRKDKVAEIVKHSPERRAREAVEEQLLPGLRRSRLAVKETLAELSRRLAGLAALVAAGAAAAGPGGGSKAWSPLAVPGPDAGSRTPFPDFHVAEGQKLIRDSSGSGGGGETEKMDRALSFVMEGQNHEKESPDMEEGAEDEEAPARETAEPRADARTPVRAFAATEDGEQSREEAPGEEDGGGAAGLASGGDVVSEELGGEGGTQSGADADKAEEGGQRVVVKEGEREPATDGEARGEASGENETDAESEVVRADVGDIEADVKPLMQFETIQEGAESVMEQVKVVKQISGEFRRLAEFGTAGTVEGIDCHLWKKLQHRYFTEAKGPARHVRKANEIGKMMAKLMKEIIRSSKKNQRRNSNENIGSPF